jgi:Lrp/AsnC family leucine-responsive transcriptional regulator
MTGEMDYLLHVLVRDLEAYGHFTMAVLLKMPGVKDVKSSLALEVVKDSTALPLERMDDRPAIAGKRK